MPDTPWYRQPVHASGVYPNSPLHLLERRRKTLRNRARRFINGYWLVPLLGVYLELLTVLVPPINTPIQNLYERNLSFVDGGREFYRLATHNFPFTLAGHFREILIRKEFELGVGQVPFEDLVAAAKNRTSMGEIHRMLMDSKAFSNTEMGGIITITYGPDAPQIHLYEIDSINGVFSSDLHREARRSSHEFMAWINQSDHRDFLRTVQISDSLTDNLINVLDSERINEAEKRKLIDVYVHAYDLNSESRYLLSPYDYKSILGSGVLEGSYVGIFHFHNDLLSPPSEVDVAGSSRDRQVVITLAEDGFILYDLSHGIHHQVGVIVNR
jgi:hypothetical protein